MGRLGGLWPLVMSGPRYVQPGDAPRWSASEHNAFVAAAIAHQIRQDQRSGTPGALGQTALPVDIKNLSGAARAVGDVLVLGTPVLDPNTTPEVLLQRPIFNAAKSTSPVDDLAKACVVTRGGPSDEILEAAIAGGVWAFVNVTSAAHGYANCESGQARFTSDAMDGFPIIFKPAGTGVKKCFVTLDRRGGSAGQTVKIGKTDAGVSPGGTVTVSVWRRVSGTLVDTGENVTGVFYDWIDAAAIATGKEVVIQYFNDEGLWRIVDAECP